MSGSLNTPPVAGIAGNWLQNYKQPDLASTLGTVQNILQSQQQIEQSKQAVQNMQTEQQAKQQEMTLGQSNYLAGRLGTAAYLPLEQQTPELYHGILDDVQRFGPKSPAFQSNVDSLRAKIDNSTPEERQVIARNFNLSLASPDVQQGMVTQQGVTTTIGPNNQPVQVGTQQAKPGFTGPGGAAAGVLTSPQVPGSATSGIPSSMTPSERSQVQAIPQPGGGVVPVTSGQIADAQARKGAGGAVGIPGIGELAPSEQQKQLAGASVAADQKYLSAATSPATSDLFGSLDTIRELSPEVATGKGTLLKSTIHQIISTMPGLADALGIRAEDSENMQVLAKAIARTQMAQSSPSDMQLLARISGSPNWEQLPGAMQTIARYVEGLALQERVTAMETHAQAKHLPLDANSFTEPTRLAIQQKFDPNAFRLFYDPNKLEAYLATLKTPAQKQRFKNTLEMIDRDALPSMAAK